MAEGDVCHISKRTLGDMSAFPDFRNTLADKLAVLKLSFSYLVFHNSFILVMAVGEMLASRHLKNPSKTVSGYAFPLGRMSS